MRANEARVKRDLVALVLAQLGHDVPDDEALDRVLVGASREFKSARGIDPGPGVRLDLVPVVDPEGRPSGGPNALSKPPAA